LRRILHAVGGNSVQEQVLERMRKLPCQVDSLKVEFPV
jgi:hypothetical protein